MLWYVWAMQETLLSCTAVVPAELPIMSSFLDFMLWCARGVGFQALDFKPSNFSPPEACGLWKKAGSLEWERPVVIWCGDVFLLTFVLDGTSGSLVVVDTFFGVTRKILGCICVKGCTSVKYRKEGSIGQAQGQKVTCRRPGWPRRPSPRWRSTRTRCPRRLRSVRTPQICKIGLPGWRLFQIADSAFGIGKVRPQTDSWNMGWGIVVSHWTLAKNCISRTFAATRAANQDWAGTSLLRRHSRRWRHDAPDDVVLVDKRGNHVQFAGHVDGAKQRLCPVVTALKKHKPNRPNVWRHDVRSSVLSDVTVMTSYSCWVR